MGCAGSASSNPTRTDSRISGARRALSAIGPSQGGVYLGAWINSSASGAPTPQQIIAQTAALESTMPRSLALHLHYFSWSQMKSIASSAEIQDDIQHNRIPLISLHCKDDMQKPALDLNGIATNPAAVADITTIGQQLAQLQSADGAAYPIMLRWFWEFNLNSVNGSQGINGNDGCFDSNKPNYPTEFVTAWDKIYATLSTVTPQPNVSMVWNPNVTNSISSAGPYAAFYPGAGYVDWIGFDGYDKENTSGNPVGFSNIFAGNLKDVAVTNAPLYGGKPILIGETGSCNEYVDPNTQAEYLASVSSTLKSGVAPWTFVKALLYFDAPGSYTFANGGQCTYSLQSGLAQWDTLSGDPYFEAFVTIP